MKPLKPILIITALAAVVYGYKTHFAVSFVPPDPKPFLFSVRPDASAFEETVLEDYRYFKAQGPSGGDIGVVFVTTELAQGVKGYSGPVPVLVGMRPDGTLTGILLLDNNETPSYAARVNRPAFTKGFKDKPVTDGLVLDGDIDGVSRATVTAKAVADGVRESGRRMASDVYGMSFNKDEKPSPAFLKDPGFYMIAALFFVSLGVFFMARTGRNLSLTRWVILAASLGVIGLYKAAPVSIANYFGMAALRMPGLDSAAWYILVAGGLVSALLWGRQYCGYLCPYGALQEFLSKLPIPKITLPAGVDGFGRWIKYALLWALVLAAFYTGLIEMGAFEPFGTLFSYSGTSAAWALVGVSLAGALVVPRFWCRYLCPVGALHGACASVAPLGGRRFAGCTNCGACSPVCTMGNREDGEDSYRKSECIGCGACVSVCPERGIESRWRASDE